MCSARAVWPTAAVVVLVALSLGMPAQAGKWPRPAAGDSASGGPEVLFTFDDGPDARVTASILDTLAEHDVGAIFFWNGRRVRPARERRRALVQRAVREGHLVANHTIHHVHLCSVPAREAAREIDVNARTFAELSGLPILLFRAPYGDSCKRLRRMLAERDLAHLHWDIDPQEFLHHSGEQTARYVIRKLRNLDDHERGVVLMHDTQPATARALPLILRWIERENRRRERRGRPPMRILSGSDLVAERHETPLIDWAAALAGSARGRVQDALADLVPQPRDTLAGATQRR